MGDYAKRSDRISRPPYRRIFEVACFRRSEQDNTALLESMLFLGGKGTTLFGQHKN
jgi:hypothetical protein